MSDQSSASSKKRKQVSEAEKLALELSKLTSKQVHQSKVKFENNQIVFLESSKSLFTNACTWKDDKLWPRYCKKAEFKFEAYLPDRKYLTRYSVNCSTCYEDGDSAVHLYCSYCDEILTGSIAGPGGKITDHLITIRHVYQEAIALSTYFEQKGWSREQEYQPAKEYVKKLEEWSETIRYPKNSLKKTDFDDVIRSLRVQLSKASGQSVRNLPSPARAPPPRANPPPPRIIIIPAYRTHQQNRCAAARRGMGAICPSQHNISAPFTLPETPHPPYPRRGRLETQQRRSSTSRAA